MDSMNLLVIDRYAETAERVQSSLRNSGTQVHSIKSSTTSDAQRALKDHGPIGVLFASPDPALASFREISELTERCAIPIAHYCPTDDLAELAWRLRESPCPIIDSGSTEQLTAFVQRIASGSELRRASARERAELEELQQRFDLLLDSTRDAIAYIHEGLHVHANRAYLEALGAQSLAEISGLSLLEVVRAEEVDLKKLLKGLSRGEIPGEAIAAVVHRPDGSAFDAQLSFSAARFGGEACVQMLVYERDAAAQLVVELERMRVTDSLTRLSNKRAFVEELEKQLASPRAAERMSAVLYLEPDGWGELADELHLSSIDAYLAEIARILQSSIGPADIAARISDNGFAVLTSQKSMTDIEELATGILRRFHGQSVEVEDRTLPVSCSIGIAMVGRLARNAPAVISGARKAQSEAAGKGNSVVTFRPQLTAITGSESDRQWIERMRFALTNGDFHAVQQPIVDLDGEAESLVENLIFMRDESGDHPPQKFMGIADRNNLAGAIERAVIPGLLQALVSETSQQFISLSSNSVLDLEFPGWLKSQIKEARVAGSRLIIQVSAGVAQSNLKPVQRLMEELRPLGCLFSISAFTPERRCAQLLEHLRADYLRIHPSFTDNLTGNSASQEAIRSMVDSAEANGVKVIADEVTDTPSLAILWQCGIKMIAGAFLKENSQVVGQ